MVATLLRLRATLLRRTLAAEPWRLVLLVLGAVWALLMVPSVVGGTAWVSHQAPDVAHDVLVVVGTLLLLGWAVVPVLVPALDDSLDVRRFATSGVAPRRLVPGLLLASLLGVPTAFTGAIVLAPVLAWAAPDRGAARLAAVLLAPVLLVTCVATARVSTGLAARVLAARRAREVTLVAAALAVAGLTVVVAQVRRLGLEGVLEQLPAVAAALGWTPLGAGWSAPAMLAAGDVPAAVGQGLVAVAGAGAALAAWAVLLERALVQPPSRSGRRRRRRDAVLPRPRPAPATAPLGPTATRPGLVAARAVARRSLRSWTTDPRYTSALAGAVVLPVLIVLLAATVVDAPAAVALSMAPLMAGTIAWGRHNDTAFDGSALWLHVVSHVPGWADRAGRAVATAVWAVPLLVAVGVAGALVGGQPDLAPASVGAALGVLGAGLAVSAVSSAALVYPVPAPGASPFAAQAGSLGASLVAQLVTSCATAVACLPVTALFLAALWWRPALSWAVLGFGVLGGAGLLTAGVVLGGRVYEARAVGLLARLD
nr:ABC transporter permease [uncultured Actinotalea sp.]